MYKNESKNHLDKTVKDVITDNTVAIIAMSFLVVFLLIGSVAAYAVGVQSGKSTAKETINEMKLNYETKISALEDDFILGMVQEDLATNPHELTKSKLKAYITDVQVTLDAFTSFKLNEQKPEAYAELQAKYDEAVKALETGDYLYPYTDAEFNLCCRVVMNEQGANVSTDEAQQGVLWVVLNRQSNGGINGRLENPTILDILQEPGQYGNKYTTDNPDVSDVTPKVKENVRKVLEREVEPWPENVLFQAMFPQGTGVYKKIYNPKPFDSYTYFCYGNLAK